MSETVIDIVDYGAGNIGSILRCLDRLDARYQRVGNQQLPTGNNPLMFPGVGAFGASMAHLHQGGLAKRLQDLIANDTPYLGICIGLQVLFEGSEEAPDITGLGLISGKVVRFQKGKTPQIGWNWIEPNQPSWDGDYAYFVNSYYPQPNDSSCTLYQADYHGRFTAAVQQGNITAFQFHPEKSGPFGQKLIERWLRNVG